METRPGRPGRRGLGGGRGGGWGSRTLRPRSRRGLLASLPTSSGGAWRCAPGAESRAICEAARGPARDARHCSRREPQGPLRATSCRASRAPRAEPSARQPAQFPPPPLRSAPPTQQPGDSERTTSGLSQNRNSNEQVAMVEHFQEGLLNVIRKTVQGIPWRSSG